MLRHYFAPILFLFAGAVAEAQNLPLPPSVASDPASVESALKQLARTAMDAYKEPDRDRYLNTMFRLEAAVGRYSDAAALLGSLYELRRSTRTRPAAALIPYQIYLDARVLWSSTSPSLERAFFRSFTGRVNPLDDKAAAELLPWFPSSAPQPPPADALAAWRGKESIPVVDAVALLTRVASDEMTAFLAANAPALLRADAERRYLIDEQSLVKTPDGASIAVLVVRPKTATAPLTTLLNFTIYANDAWSFADATKMAAYGYAGVIAYTRGKGRSPDQPVPYEHDGADATAVIDWIAAQSWSDGRVGMFSGSYNAFTQWAAAKHMPKALKAMATSASNAPGIDTPMQGNIFENFFYPWPLYVTKTKGLDDANYNDRGRWASLNRNWYLSGKPYRAMQTLDKEPNPWFQKWLSHPSYDEYWQRLIPYREEFAKVNIPVLTVTGYFDGGMVGALYYLKQHLKYLPKADNTLLIGPWDHIAMQRGVLPNFNGYTVDAAGRIDLQEIRLQWFDHVFKGAAKPEILSGAVNYEVMGANVWKHASSIEAMGDSTERFYLTSTPDGSNYLLSRKSQESLHFVKQSVDFKDRKDVDYQGPDGLISKLLDTRDSVVYVSDPIKLPMEIDGTFSGTLELIANKRDLDLSVAMYQQLPDGQYFPLASSIFRASYLKDRSHRHLLTPGEKTRLSFTTEQMSSRQLEAGSRIVFVLGVVKQPEFQINYGTGKDVSDESVNDAKEPLQVKWSDTSFIDIRAWRPTGPP